MWIQVRLHNKTNNDKDHCVRVEGKCVVHSNESDPDNAVLLFSIREEDFGPREYRTHTTRKYYFLSSSSSSQSTVNNGLWHDDHKT